MLFAVRMDVDLPRDLDPQTRADTLARDLHLMTQEHPDGHEVLLTDGPAAFTIDWQEGSEPTWWDRYPGW